MMQAGVDYVDGDVQYAHFAETLNYQTRLLFGIVF
jgi:hypothetical protein